MNELLHFTWYQCLTNWKWWVMVFCIFLITGPLSKLWMKS